MDIGCDSEPGVGVHPESPVHRHAPYTQHLGLQLVGSTPKRWRPWALPAEAPARA